MAESAKDLKARQWVGSLTNNLGWTYHDEGKYDLALKTFEKALKFRETVGDAKSIIIAKWCVARCLRSLGHVDEALSMQHELLVENEKLAAPDGYNSEKLGELLLHKGQKDEARIHLRRAAELLGANAWLLSMRRLDYVAFKPWRMETTLY